MNDKKTCRGTWPATHPMNKKTVMEVFRRTLWRMFLIVIVVAGLLFTPVPVVRAGQTDIVGPLGSDSFGESVTVLPNGNVVVIDPYYDVGAVYLYDGATRVLISTLTGSAVGDQVGAGGVEVLSNGNYVVISQYWDNGAMTDAGAVTWGNGTTGVTGTISAANSLVGATAGDRVGYGYGGVTALSNGHYVVISEYWNNGGAAGAGAVTWGNGTTGVTGTISAANSLVGATAGDGVGYYGVTLLSNGNYVVRSPHWHNGGAAYAGAVTWGDGTTGITGTVSAANSLVGATAGDRVGYYDVTLLGNGHYVVRSPEWHNGGAADAGAVTWGDATTGVTGTVSAANSLVGSTTYDQVGSRGVAALSNGNYVVGSPDWDNGGAANAGAATWGDGTTGITGTISAANSLVGSTADDQVGYYVIPLSNGHYVVRSFYWDNGGAANAGAATWGDGTTGITGTISAANSLVGSTAGDRVGSGGVAALSNGHYVVNSPSWDNGGVTDAGAVTWGNGTTGITGTVSAANSLVGSMAGDQVGSGGVAALSNGNYVVSSRYWHNGGAAKAGAVTWGNGTTGITGTVSAANSLVGSTADDQVGHYVIPLSNGNYVVRSPDWHNGGAAYAGAVTWGDGTTGVSGTVSAANSLVGSTTYDQVGYVVVLSNGNYVVISRYWDNGGATDAGAVAWGDATTGVTGTVSAANSLVGATADDQVGSRGVAALSDGYYVVSSPYWDSGGTTDAGAATWGNETTGITGTVSAANSLVGSTAFDQVGYDGVVALSNGHYVVRSPYWDNGAVADAGAVTWGNGTTGITGTISAANSLVGSTAGDWVGYDGVGALSNGYYVMNSPDWDNGFIPNAGAVTLGGGTGTTVGPVTGTNSVRGWKADSGPDMHFVYDDANGQLVVGRPAENIVTLFSLGIPIADAGSDQSVDTNALVTLDGSGSSDPDGDLPLTYGWAQTGGPSVTFNDALSITTFIAPGDPTVLTFTLTVTDSLGHLSNPDKVVVTVNNQSPVADAGGDQSVDIGDLATLDGSASSDPDGDLPLAYLWAQTGGASVTFNAALSVTTFTALGTPGVLTFTLTVTDSLGLASVPDEVTVTVLPPNQVDGVSPEPHSHTALVTTTLAISTTKTVSQTSVTSRTVSVHGGFHGHLDGAFSFSSSLTFDPDPNLHPGELVHASVTTGVLDSQSRPLGRPYVWQFRTAASGGSGHFPTKNTAGLGGDYSQAVVVGDVDGDDDLDMAVASWNQPNRVYLNDGDGTFDTISRTVGTGSDPTTALALGDLDGDGDLDLVVGNRNDQSVVYLNDGDGTFDTISHTLGASPDFTVALALGDLDGDGDLDVVTGNWSQAKVCLNDGDGSFDIAPQPLGAGSSGVYALAVGDLEGDGDLDLVLGRSSNENRVYLNDGDGSFDTTSYALDASDATYALVAGDVDGDGDLDLAVGNFGEPGAVYLNDGDGTFDTISHTIGTASDNMRALALADVDGDGDLDLAAANNGTQNTVYLNDGDGTFDAISRTFGIPGEASPRSLAAGDVDGDGDLDLAVAKDGPENEVYLNADSADLAIVKERVGPSVVYPGDGVTYTLTISNTGPQAAFGVVVTDRIPISVTHASLVVQSSLAITATGGVNYVWEVEPLSAGEWGVITVTGVLSDPLAASTFTNTATIASAAVDADTANNSSSAWLTVEAILNQAPIADAGSDQSVDTNAIVTLNGSGSSDPDGDLPLTYGWTQTGGPAVTLSDPAVVAPTFTAPGDPAVLTFTLTVTDSLDLPDPTPDEVVITVNNQAPIANAGSDQGVDTNAIVTLDGSGSSDPDGDLPLTYLWTQTGGPAVTLSNPAVVAPTFTAPDDPAVLTFALTVTDSLGLADPTPDEVVITVNNRAPVADAGSDQSVDTGALVTLDGSSSSDPDGDLPLAYYWAQTGGPAVTLSNPAVVAPTFIAPGDPAVLTFTLAVTDSLGLPNPIPDEVVVTVEGYRIYLPLVVRQVSSGAEVIAPPGLAWSRHPSWRFQRALPAEAAVIE